MSFRADIPLRGMTAVNKTFSVEDPATKSQHGELPMPTLFSLLLIRPICAPALPGVRNMLAARSGLALSPEFIYPADMPTVCGCRNARGLTPVIGPRGLKRRPGQTRIEVTCKEVR